MLYILFSNSATVFWQACCIRWRHYSSSADCTMQQLNTALKAHCLNIRLFLYFFLSWGTLTFKYMWMDNYWVLKAFCCYFPIYLYLAASHSSSIIISSPIWEDITMGLMEIHYRIVISSRKKNNCRLYMESVILLNLINLCLFKRMNSHILWGRFSIIWTDFTFVSCANLILLVFIKYLKKLVLIYHFVIY